MSTPEPPRASRKQQVLNVSLAVVAGQAGCVTLVIVLAAVLFGLWLDSRFDTRPVITLVLVAVSIPVSLAAMLAIVRAVVKRIKAEASGKETTGVGTNSKS